MWGTLEPFMLERSSSDLTDIVEIVETTSIFKSLAKKLLKNLYGRYKNLVCDRTKFVP